VQSRSSRRRPLAATHNSFSVSTVSPCAAGLSNDATQSVHGFVDRKWEFVIQDLLHVSALITILIYSIPIYRMIHKFLYHVGCVAWHNVYYFSTAEVVGRHTGWSKIFSAPDDYNTESYK
jgi:hypothetical protein